MKVYRTGIDHDKHNGISWYYIQTKDGAKFYHPDAIEKFEFRCKILEAKGYKKLI
jgi:hypothetical protein